MLTHVSPYVAARRLEGVALFELDDDSCGGVPPVRQHLRPVLLSNDSALVAEVASASSCDANEAESVVLLVGHALAADAPAALVTLAAGVAMQRRWPATLARLLRAVAAANATLPAGVDTLLHAAVRTGDTRIVDAVCAAGAACGTAVSLGAQSSMPMHLAAAAPDHAARAVMLAAMCDADARAPVAWFAARDASGRTPAQYAAVHGGGGAVAMSLRDRLIAARGIAVATLQRTQDEQGVFVLQHALEVAATMLAESDSCCSQATLDAIAVLTAVEQMPIVPQVTVPAGRLDYARALLLHVSRWVSEVRMPGAFVDPEMERVWLANTAAQCCRHDTCVYGVCGLIHLVEVARFTPSAPTQLAAQLLCVRAPLRTHTRFAGSVHAR